MSQSKLLSLIDRLEIILSSEQPIKIKPKKGLSVIWPADFTYTHRGIPSPTQEKYIATGWFHMV